jgi:hypothetical protein
LLKNWWLPSVPKIFKSFHDVLASTSIYPHQKPFQKTLLWQNHKAWNLHKNLRNWWIPKCTQEHQIKSYHALLASTSIYILIKNHSKNTFVGESQSLKNPTKNLMNPIQTLINKLHMQYEEWDTQIGKLHLCVFGAYM